MNDQIKHLLFVVNPISGVRKRDLEGFAKLVEKLIDQNIFSAEISISNYAGHASLLAKEAYSNGTRHFVVVGGDGSVNEVATVLKGTDASLGIIPAGSGNGLARHLNIPLKTPDAIAMLNHWNVLEIDTCTVNNVFFVSIAGIGFDARVAREFEKSKGRGFTTYARTAIKEYFNYKPKKYSLQMDGTKLKTEAFFITFANSSQFGYNTRISPEASITDGLIDVCIVRRPPLIAVPAVAHLVFRQKTNKSKYIEIYRASEILVKRKKGKTVNVDGEPIKMKKELIIKTAPASLKVVVPLAK